jgi:HAD superfamily hydrolase (TIGR01484 family)
MKNERQGMKPIASMDAETALAIRWVLTDIDDTMTMHGKLVPEAYATLCDLKRSGLRVIAVTGRSAGWGRIHLQEWPLDGAITENGAVSYYNEGTIIHPSAVRNTDPALLRSIASALQAVPRAKPSGDNDLRLFDYAIDHAEKIDPPLTSAEVAEIVGIFERGGCMAKPSSIHINTWMGSFNKREAALDFLGQREGYVDARDRDKVLYVGDALNDEVMFEYFPNACAVANIDIWLDRMTHTPAWVSKKRYGEGFAEIGKHLLSLRVNAGPNPPASEIRDL